MEHELVATICVFLPSGQFIVDGERDTLFESTIVVGSQSDDKTVNLQAKRNVEIL